MKKILGMDIIIVTTANSSEEGKALLVEFGFPFEKIKYRIMAKESMKAKELKGQNSPLNMKKEEQF